MNPAFSKLILPVLVAFFGISPVSAQMYNDGGVLRIGAGGLIFCSGNFTNANGGSVGNDAVLEVQGNFVNSATYNSPTSKDTLRLSGATSITVATGGAIINNLLVNKTSATGITLLSNLAVATRFELQAGTFSTDPVSTYELVAPSAAVFSYAAGTQVVGKVRRTGWANNATVVFNQTNMAVRTTSGTAPTDILVSMVPAGDPSAIEREVKRTFFFTPTGGTGYTADVTFPYTATELNTNTEANLVPWYYASGTEWNSKLTGNTINTASDFITSTAIPPANFANTEWKLADPLYTFTLTTLLAGAWNGTSLNTSLNSGGVLPLSQPYNTTPFNYTGTELVTAIPNANVVDWVLVELRKPATGIPADALSSTVIGRKAGFVLANGSIVNPDGVTPVSFNISKQGASFIAVRHLNHLGALSNSIPSNAAGTFSNDFSLLTGSYKDASSPSNPVVLLSGNVKYGLWAGDANKNGIVNATDISAIKSAIAASTTGYQLTDVNRSNSINATDVSLTKATISASGTGSLGARTANGNIKSNLPD